MTTQRIPKPGEVWTDNRTGEVVKVSGLDQITMWTGPDCTEQRTEECVLVHGPHSPNHDAWPLDEFLDRFTPPEPQPEVVGYLAGYKMPDGTWHVYGPELDRPFVFDAAWKAEAFLLDGVALQVVKPV